MKKEDALLQNDLNVVSANEGKDALCPWKLVTLGGVAGILMGAGSLYTGQIIAKEFESEKNTEDAPETQTTEDKLKVADVEPDLSFGKAFAAARAEVGPGGVFYWHGGIYNTFTAEEWNSMTRAEKDEFAQRVRPEIQSNELSTPTDTNTHVVVVHHVYHTEESHQPGTNTEEVKIVGHQSDNNGEQDGDVHIVGFTNVHGHLAVGLDVDSDGTADVAIIDVDDNLEISKPDLVVDKDGNSATVGSIIDSQDPNLDTLNDSADITEESPVNSNYQVYDI